MRNILLALALAVMWAGVVQGQQELTGKKAEQVKQEILKLEHEKLETLLQNGETAAHWRDTHDADQVINAGANGTIAYKAQMVSRIRSGELKLVSQKQYGHQVHVYNDGNVAVCTFISDGIFDRHGEHVPVKTSDVDVWSKFPDGAWRRIVHSVHTAPAD